MGGILCSFSTALYPEATSSAAAGPEGSFSPFLWCVAGGARLLSPARCFPSHILPEKTRSFIPPAQGLHPSPLETQAVSKGPGCPRSCSEPLIPCQLQQATSRSWCFRLFYSKQHNRVREKLLPDCKLSFDGAANA